MKKAAGELEGGGLASATFCCSSDPAAFLLTLKAKKKGQ